MKNRASNCPFCAQDIGVISFFETESFYTIYNRSPILPGHSLLIPKRHIESLLDFTDDELGELMMHAKEAILLLQKAFRSEGFNLSLQEKEEAGQSLAHFHLHLIPRKPGDFSRPGDWYAKLKEGQAEILDSEDRPILSREEMKEMAEFIKNAKLMK